MIELNNADMAKKVKESTELSNSISLKVDNIYAKFRQQKRITLEKDTFKEFVEETNRTINDL